MQIEPSDAHKELLRKAHEWRRTERQLDAVLSNIKGISFADYRLLRSLADAPSGQASRVELATSVGLTASGVTRSLRPLEKLGFVITTKSERDARLALASLTPEGQELVSDATGVVNDLAPDLVH